MLILRIWHSVYPTLLWLMLTASIYVSLKGCLVTQLLLQFRISIERSTQPADSFQTAGLYQHVRHEPVTYPSICRYPRPGPAAQCVMRSSFKGESMSFEPLNTGKHFQIAQRDVAGAVGIRILGCCRTLCLTARFAGIVKCSLYIVYRQEVASVRFMVMLLDILTLLRL